MITTKQDREIIKQTIENYPNYLQGKLDFVSTGILFNTENSKINSSSLIQEETMENKTKIKSLSAGIINYANNCYINSILQCLFNTPELYYLCINRRNYPQCLHNKNNSNQIAKEFCAFCAFSTTLQESYLKKAAIEASLIVNNIRKISKLFHRGEQEDAHEFLRFLVDAIQESYQKNHLKTDSNTQKNPILQIFEGKLLNTIECLQCGAISKVIDPFMDLCLELCDDLQSSIKNFFKKEILTKENWYFCGKCQRRTKSSKEFSLKEFPDKLCLQLKRFNCLGRKLKKMIKFPITLNLTNYLTEPDKRHIIYELYGIVEHFGPDLHYGHYISFIKGFDDTWYKYDDSKINRIPKEKLGKVLAYILFYKRIGAISTNEKNKDRSEIKSSNESPSKFNLNNVKELNSSVILNSKDVPSIQTNDNLQCSFDISLKKGSKELINQIFSKNNLNNNFNDSVKDEPNNLDSSNDEKNEDNNLINSKSDSTNDNETKNEDKLADSNKLKHRRENKPVKKEFSRINIKINKKETKLKLKKKSFLRGKQSHYLKLKFLFKKLCLKSRKSSSTNSMNSHNSKLPSQTWFELKENEKVNYLNQVKLEKTSEVPISSRSEYEASFDQGQKPKKRKKINLIENIGSKNIFQKLCEKNKD